MTQTLRKGAAVGSDLFLIYNISLGDFRPSIGGILFHPEREIQGTGFFVSDGAILTCARVIEGFHEPGRHVCFRVEGQDTVHAAEVIHLSPKGEADIASLRPVPPVADYAAVSIGGKRVLDTTTTCEWTTCLA